MDFFYPPSPIIYSQSLCSEEITARIKAGSALSRRATSALLKMPALANRKSAWRSLGRSRAARFGNVHSGLIRSNRFLGKTPLAMARDKTHFQSRFHSPAKNSCSL